jgi:transposase
MVPGKLAIIALLVGKKMEPGIACSRTSKPIPMPFRMSTGLFLLIVRLSELTSTPQARRKRAIKKGEPHFQNEALGRSRGGLTPKIHLACDGKGRPLAFTITPGQQHDCTQLQALLDSIRIPRFGKGRPRKRPDHLIADRGYSYPFCRRFLLQRGIPHTIPERKDQSARRCKKPGRPLSFSKERYARRNVIERCINRLKQWRGFATRYEKRAVYFRAAITLISLMIWLN